MNILRFKSNCINQWTIHLNNGWTFKTTIQIKELMSCTCKQNCNHISLISSPGLIISVLPYKFCSIGIYKIYDGIHTSILDMELRQILSCKIPALTLSFSGPRINKCSPWKHRPYYDRTFGIV